MSLIIFTLTSCFFFFKAADQIHGFADARHTSTTECIRAPWITHVSANRECWGCRLSNTTLAQHTGGLAPTPRATGTSSHRISKGDVCTKVESLRTPHPYFPQSIPPALGSSAGTSDITGLSQSWGGRSLTPGQFEDPLTRSVSSLEHDEGLGRVTSGTQFP